MAFDSYFFIFVYLPLLLVGWFGLNRVSARAADVFLIGMSLWFYGCYGWAALAVLLLGIGMNYAFGRALGTGASREDRADAKDVTPKPEPTPGSNPNSGPNLNPSPKPKPELNQSPTLTPGPNPESETVGAASSSPAGGRSRRGILAAGIAADLLLLAWFKYVTPAVSASAADGASLPTFLTLALPVGLSFTTFTQIQYLLGRYRGTIPETSFLDYALYAAYFPKLSEGPITCYEEIMPQFRDATARRPDAENLMRGLILFILGLAKKLLIADVLAPAASHGLESVYYLDTLSVIVTMCCYAMQLYFDFSGFCDMAMGISQMLNIRLPLNFDAPFRAESFSGFWRRWHMTLTRFFTRNVYIPLGGSRKGKVRTWINVMAVFLLSGLWHGTGATYVAWGAATGVLVIASREWQRRSSGKEKEAGPVRTALRRVRTFLLFLLTLIPFGASSLEYSAVIFRQLFVPRFPGWLYRMAGQLDVSEFWLVNKAVSLLAPSLSNPVLLAELLLVLGIAMALVFRSRTAVQLSGTMAFTKRNAVLVGILAAWCLGSLSGVSTYLYFQF